MAAKDYSSDAVVIHWDAQRCIHTGICTRTLPEVFDVTRRPWITADAAEADAVVAAVVRCPTGALRYHRLDGGDQEEAEASVTVTPMRNGPLYVRGPIRIETADGRVIAEESRVALCRCGATANAPFCDNSHRHSGYRSADPAAGYTARAAESPADVCELQEF